MKLLATIDNESLFNSRNLDPKDFYHRIAGRAVVLTDDKKVHLLHMSKIGHYKLPGGGVDDGEDIEQGLMRELMEEIGCRAKIIHEVGKIRELRNQMKWDQMSYCYIARQIGNLSEPNLEESEQQGGATLVTADNIDHAIRLTKSSPGEDWESQFIVKRDLIFLNEAKRNFTDLF